MKKPTQGEKELLRGLFDNNKMRWDIDNSWKDLAVNLAAVIYDIEDKSVVHGFMEELDTFFGNRGLGDFYFTNEMLRFNRSIDKLYKKVKT